MYKMYIVYSSCISKNKTSFYSFLLRFKRKPFSTYCIVKNEEWTTYLCTLHFTVYRSTLVETEDLFVKLVCNFPSYTFSKLCPLLWILEWRIKQRNIETITGSNYHVVIPYFWMRLKVNERKPGREREKISEQKMGITQVNAHRCWTVNLFKVFI